MIGNDVDDDMPAQKAGMQTFLLTENLINKNGIDINGFANGDFDKLLELVKSI